jgi:hypothetical protein
MVGLWPCKVSSEIHINGRCVSEPVQKDKGKVTIPKSEDEDPKRAHMVLYKGREVAELLKAVRGRCKSREQRRRVR